VQLLVIVWSSLASSLELLAHLADLLVRLRVFDGRHFEQLSLIRYVLLGSGCGGQTDCLCGGRCVVVSVEHLQLDFGG
jgi:hypothetical protein